MQVINVLSYLHNVPDVYKKENHTYKNEKIFLSTDNHVIRENVLRMVLRMLTNGIVKEEKCPKLLKIL